MNYKGINFLKKQLFSKRNRVRMRYRYYEMKNGIKDFKIAIPNEFKYVSETLGWCSKAVDSLADRISFKEFIVSYNKTCKEKASLVSKRIRMPLNYKSFNLNYLFTLT